MYRIMLVAKEGTSDVNSLYKYLTIVNADGKIVPYEAETLEEVDKQVESMLNGNYKKKDILVVQVSEFNIEADLYKSEVPETPESSDTSDTPETPETPESSDTSDTPETPETPESSEGTTTS